MVQGLGFRVKDLGLRIWGLRFMVYGRGFKVYTLRFGLGAVVQDCGIRSRGSGCKKKGLRFGV
jgi:hypothetical protein